MKDEKELSILVSLHNIVKHKPLVWSNLSIPIAIVLEQ